MKTIMLTLLTTGIVVSAVWLALIIYGIVKDNTPTNGDRE